MAALTGLASPANRRALRLRLELVALIAVGQYLAGSALSALARPTPYLVDGLLFSGLAVFVLGRLASRWTRYLGPQARWDELLRPAQPRQRAARAPTLAVPPPGYGAAAQTAVHAARPRPVEANVAALRWLPMAGVVTASLVFRFYRLDAVPGEFYGDIAIIYDYVDAVLRGQFPFSFALSTGPLYGYFIAPLVAVLGQQGYLTYKLASVLVSLVGIWLTFLFAREVSASTRVGLLASVLLAISSWYVIFSRLGNAQILIPTVVALSYYLLASGVRRSSPQRVLVGLGASSLGLYLMPQTFVLPLAYLASAAFFLSWRRAAGLAIVAALLLAPFTLILRSQPDLFFSPAGYIGGKVEGGANPVVKVAQNVGATLLMFHVRGDPIFRSNPPGQPQLDFVSGVLLVVGAVALLRRARAVGLPLLLVPVVILLVPANLVLIESSPTPSASRSIGILPFVALATAAGVWWVRRAVTDPRLRRAIVAGIIGVVLAANWVRYFDDYASRLPDGNTPYGKLIAAAIDELPSSTSVIIASCCWGEWGQPEPKGIEYVLQRPRAVQLVARGAFSCDLLRAAGRRVYVVWDPREASAPTTPATCDPTARAETHTSQDGRTVFISYTVGG